MKIEEQYLDALAKLRDDKNLDDIGNFFREIITVYGLTVDEVAAICYYLFNNALQTEPNKVLLKEKLNLDVSLLSFEAKFQVQRALIATYVDKVRTDGQA